MQDSMSLIGLLPITSLARFIPVIRHLVELEFEAFKLAPTV